MAAEVLPAHLAVRQWSLNIVQPMTSVCHATPAMPFELSVVAAMMPARKVPCPAHVHI